MRSMHCVRGGKSGCNARQSRRAGSGAAPIILRLIFDQNLWLIGVQPSLRRLYTISSAFVPPSFPRCDGLKESVLDFAAPQYIHARHAARTNFVDEVAARH
ncbi:MAG: hypothetical protein IT556_01150 [Acetobacteraceae bacterium]|nr:hypothetical protein [Acetobacteraceae bacterium]